jgi:hypothetical protein
MLSKEYQISSSFDPASWDGRNFLREPGKPEGLVDVPERILVGADGAGGKKLQKI